MADAARVIDPLLDALAELVAEKLAARLAAVPAASAYYSQNDSPLGKRRYLEAARAECFPSSKRGKLVLALRVDVDAWVAAGARVPREQKPANDEQAEAKPEADDEAEALAALAAAGVRVAPKGGR